MWIFCFRGDYISTLSLFMLVFLVIRGKGGLKGREDVRNRMCYGLRNCRIMRNLYSCTATQNHLRKIRKNHTESYKLFSTKSGSMNQTKPKCLILRE